MVLSDRYTLDVCLHQGSGQQVWRARAADGPVVVKLATRADRVPVLRHEAEVLARLSHPGIVAILEYVEGCLVLPLVPGVSLSRRLRTDRLGPRQATALARSIASALQHCHGRGIVHCDVKAANTVVDGEALVLVDFGVAREVGSIGVPRGSVHTMAPEQICGDVVDGRTDLYAVGVLLYRGLSGHYPFHSRNLGEVLAAHLNATPDPLVDVPQGLWAVVRRCMAKSPAGRPATAGALLDALSRLDAETPSQTRLRPVRGLA